MAKLGDLVARIGADTREFNKALGQVSRQTGAMVGNIEKMGKQMSMSLTAPIALIAGKGFQTFRAFEFQMAKVAAVSGATASEFKSLKDNAQELGASTRYTSTEVAALQTEYAKLGFSAQEIVNVTDATLALAQATDTDLARAAEVAGSTLRAFQMPATDTAKLADVMALSFSSTALDMESFAEAMKYVAPVAKAAGLSVEETTAMLGTLANAGIKGSQAGTSLRRIITDMGSESGTAADKIASLGAKGMTLKDAFDEVGRTAQSALLVLANGSDKTAELSTSFDNASGAAKRMQATMDATAEGSIKKMESALEAVMLQIGESLAPTISAAADQIGSLAMWFTKLDASTRETIMTIGAVVAAVGPLIVGVTKIIGIYKQAAVVVQSLSKVMLANPYLLAAAALGTLAYKMSEYVSFTTPAEAATNSLNSAMTSAAALAASEGAEVNRLSAFVQDNTKSEEARAKALEDLKKLAPEYFGTLDMEAVKTGQLTKAVDDYRAAILNAARTKVLTQALEEQVAKMEELKGELADGPNMWDKMLGNLGGPAGATALHLQRIGIDAENTQASIDALTNELNNMQSVVPATKTVAEQLKELALQMRHVEKGSEAHKALQAEYDALKESVRGAKDEVEGFNDGVAATPAALPFELETHDFSQDSVTPPTVNGTLNIQDIEVPEEMEIMDGTDLETINASLDSHAEKMQRAVDLGSQFGESLGSAFGSIISGSASAGDAMKAVGKEILKTLIGIAKANAIAAFSSPTNPLNAATGGLAMPAVIAGGLSLVEGLLGAIAFADGGIVSGPTLGLVGEYSGARNNPEVIAPLDKLQSMLGGAGGMQHVVVEGKISGTDIALVQERGTRRLNRRR
jgi:phage-related minor tail protein